MSLIRNPNEVYIIAEIGQNHNGDIEIAKKLIDQLDRYTYDPVTGNRLYKPNAIKLTKRDLDEELTLDAASKPYIGPNSFGKTYGEHREFLELSYEEHVQLGDYARSRGFDFIVTACSPRATSIFDMVKVDYIKVASRDLTNIPLLYKLSVREEPIIISTGMATEQELETALEVLSDTKISILHCISEYPAKFSNLNLNSINWLLDKYNSKYSIGYSDHSLGSSSPLIAVALGANIIEKHVTLDTNMKGSDHKGSADIETFHKMTNNIRLAEISLGVSSFLTDKSFIKNTKLKLQRSLCYNKDIRSGTVVTLDDLHMLSPGDGLSWDKKESVLGKVLKKNVNKNTLVSIEDYEKS
tara:strand:+ start:446 stop:1510 length:1065 start_codon:yes stop_codon:yes gene_type:complete